MPKSLNLDNKTSDFLKTVKLCLKNKASTANTANKFYFPGNFLVEKIPCIWAKITVFTVLDPPPGAQIFKPDYHGNHWLQRSSFSLVCFFNQSTLFSPNIIKICDMRYSMGRLILSEIAS